ncbi:MAG TPA: ATP-binding protein [Gemmatimonadaceae bacterium]|jgi:two-component system NarL family sensor kinase|nr:ATP-binding protein [Gemmatimonadaceae bacterium]
MNQSRIVQSVLRVPLAWKIAGANALLTIALVVGLYLLPATHPDLAASSSLAIIVLLAAGAVNVALITLALYPIRDLERTVELVWSGATEVRVKRSALADRDLRRVAHTVDALLERLASDRTRLQQLTGKLVEARATERAALARELTESVAQSATGLALECASLKAAGETQNAERFERMAQTAMSLVEEVRRIARDVHPRHIDELGLDVALRSLAREMTTAFSQVSYSARGLPVTAEQLPHDVACALYDVARESIKNARRHGEARDVRVALGIERYAVLLRVFDNGCGFDPKTVDRNRGTGIGTMRERIALVGGSLKVQSGPGKGTQVVATVPLTQPMPVERRPLVPTYQEA